MRNTFISELMNMAESDPTVFLLTADLGFSVLEPFASKFPSRFVNVGIAEQNMMGIASGLASEGYKVFVYSIGNFPTLRCMEQIRYDVCYQKRKVTIVAVGAGFAYGSAGASHHTTEDISMLRSIPELVVTSPADRTEVKTLMKFFSTSEGPGYLRLNKAGEPDIHSDGQLSSNGFEPFFALEGEKVLVCSTGAITSHALEFCKGNGYALLSFPFISPMGTRWITERLSKFPDVITLEEQQLNAGFGSAVLEQVSDLFSACQIPFMPRIKRVGIPNRFIRFSGTQDYLREHAGLKLF